MTVRSEVWCVPELTGDSQSNCNNRKQQIRIQDTGQDNDLDYYHLYVKKKGDTETYSYWLVYLCFPPPIPYPPTSIKRLEIMSFISFLTVS